MVRRVLDIVSPNGVYTVGELSRILKIGKQTVYNNLSEGTSLPKHFKVGRSVRFTGAAIIEFIEEQGGGGI